MEKCSKLIKIKSFSVFFYLSFIFYVVKFYKSKKKIDTLTFGVRDIRFLSFYFRLLLFLCCLLMRFPDFSISSWIYYHWQGQTFQSHPWRFISQVIVSCILMISIYKHKNLEYQSFATVGHSGLNDKQSRSAPPSGLKWIHPHLCQTCLSKCSSDPHF